MVLVCAMSCRHPDRKSTRLNSSHQIISYAVFCLKKFCASLGLLHAEGMLSLPYEAVLLAAAATAWLMISPIRMFALKFHGFGWTGNRLRYLFLGACVVLILTLGAYAIPAFFVLYVVVSLVRWLLQGRRAAEA